MYSHEIFIQTKGYSGQILNGLLLTASSAIFDHMITSVAYVTENGCQLLIDAFNEEIQNWEQMRKDWLISFDYGITDPAALKYLADLPNSFVCIPNANDALNNNLRPRNKFHTKLYTFKSQNPDVLAIFSGSANLTTSGLLLNDEQATSSIWLPQLDETERALINDAKERIGIIDNAFNSATPLDLNLLTRYGELNRELRDMGEDDTDLVQRITQPNPDVGISKASALASASSFWVEVRYVVENLGSGRPGNQIDLQRGSRVFFGFGVGEVPRNTYLGPVLIRYGEEMVECSMRFGNNHMDKLNLPIPGEPGPPTYRNRILLFERDENSIFNLYVGSMQGMDEIRQHSIQQGTIYLMQSGREYGVFS